MIFSGILIGVGLGLVMSAIVISVYHLTAKRIRERVKNEIPEAEYVEIQKLMSGKNKTVLPTYKAKAYNKQGTKIRDIEFKYKTSDYFYNREKIYV